MIHNYDMPNADRDKYGYIYPFFSKNFNKWLDTWNLSNMSIFEWGSGYSTIWFASRCKKIISIEYDIEWYDHISDLINKFGFKDKASIIKRDYKPLLNNYNDAINMNNNIYDMIVIDGRNRCKCSENLHSHIKNGSIIILDDCERENYKPIKQRFIGYPYFECIPESNGKTAGVWFIVNQDKEI